MFEKKANVTNRNSVEFKGLPIDQWSTVELIAVRGFIRPGSPIYNTKDEPAVQFLFAGTDTEGNPVRKWTKDVNFKYGGKMASALEKLFGKIDLMEEDPETGDTFLDGIIDGNSVLWNSNYDVFYEEQRKAKGGTKVYNGITKIRFNVDAQNYERKSFYDKTFVPFKYVSLYGGKVMCELQDVYAMTEDGLVHWDKNDFKEKEA